MARRVYNAKHRAGSASNIVDSVPIDSSCDWDAGAIQSALSQARQIEEWDRDAADQLRTQAQAAKAKLDGSTSTIAEPFDLMRLYARVLRHYNGGITDADFARMDYRRFFGYVRELDIMLEEEAEASKGGKKTSPEETRAMINTLPHAQEYEGEVIKLI